MGFGGVMLALSAVQSVSQIGQGYAERGESKLNSTILEGQIGLVDIQKGIENEQYNRLKGKTLSTSYANLGASGIMPSGSALEVMLDTQKQINLDQAIGQFNYEQQKNYIRSQQGAIERKGKQAISTGYSNAFSTMLSSVSRYYI